MIISQNVLRDIVRHDMLALMIERRTLSVSLTPELHAFIGELVKGGAYSNASEVVRAGLRLLREDEARRQAAPLTPLAAASSGGREAKA